MALRNAFEDIATEATLEEINAKTPALASGRVPVVAADLPLPTGAATEATLAALNGKLPSLDAGRVPVAAASLPLPTGAAAEDTQLLALAELQSLDAKTPALASGRVPVAASLVTADGAPISHDERLPVSTGNVLNKFREAFETYTPGAVWTETLGTGDIITLDGNAAAASYLVISKDPLSAGTVSSISTVATFGMPFDAGFGLSLSQRTLGQEFAVELVSDETPLAAPADLTISAIQQAASVLTVTTTAAHNLRPGMRIGIRDCADSRFNYPALVVASTPSTTQFTATAGPGGTIPSITAGPFATGSVFLRSALGFAPNGTSMIFENATATNASFYVRSEAGDALPSGTILGNHAVTIATTTSVQAINAALTYSFQPPTEFRLTQFIDGIQWTDATIDTVAAATNRYKRTQVVPDPGNLYRVRIRATNNASLSRPVAQIVTAVKTGTTTATITTDVAHGLTITDQIVIYGIRDQAATAFPNLLVATAVASIVSATQFTVVIGTASTVTSFGGYVARVNGGNLPSAIGANASVVQSVVRTSNVVTLTANVAWTGLLIGDYINLVGCRDNATGATLGIDGAYRVRNLVTTALEIEPIGSTPTGANITSTNCGGAVIRRTCIRLSFVRVLDFERQRIELMPRPQGDISAAASVNVQNNVAATINANASMNVAQVGGSALAAEDAAATAIPVMVGGVARTAAAPVTLVAGDVVRDTMSLGGAKVVKPYGVAETGWNASLSLSSTTAAPIQAAAGAGLKRHITAVQAINTGAAVADLIILDGVTERWRITLPINNPVVIEFPTELVTTANAALNANLSVAGTVRANFQGYTSA